MFQDRRDAAIRLAAALTHYRGQNALVLGVPRGAVPMARIIADALGGEMDVVLVRKIGAPRNPEFAIGAVNEFGRVAISQRDAEYSGADDAYLEGEKQQQIEIMQQIQLPIARGGMGLRPIARTLNSAYFSSLASIMPDFLLAFPRSEISLDSTRINIDLNTCREGMRHEGVYFGKSNSLSDLPSQNERTFVLQSTIPTLWVQAENSICSSKRDDFLDHRHVQNQSINYIEEKIQKGVFTHSSPFRKTLLTANTMKHSADWLTLIPCEPQFAMDNKAFQLACCTFIHLHSTQCVCRFSIRFT